MKKIISIFSCAILLVVFFGCTKQGPVGPAGPTGPTGPAGSTTVVIDTFSVPTTSWVQGQTNYYTFVRTNSNITKKVVDVGIIDVYVKTATSDWYGMPDVVAGPGQAGWRYSYGLNSLTIYADNFTSGLTQKYYFKAVIKE